MGKAKGNQRDTAFSTMSDEEFAELYDARARADSKTRLRLEKEAKARGMRNAGKDRG